MKINIKNLELKISIGVYDYEKLSTTKVLISTTVFLKHTKFEENAKIVDYDTIINTIKGISNEKHFDYIEELATKLCVEIKNLSTEIDKVAIKVQKCIFGNFIEELSVEVDA